MPLGCIRIDADDFAPVAMSCLRCGAETMLRFAGPCPACAAELHEKFRATARQVEGADYEPKMNVTPNAVALKDD
ncbi:MAG TPA: hypothetical protein VEZ15_09875 [Acidimicrobiia bacterium]|nr:hypothetical protein [Acidimicrobiia bacterium]